VMNQVKLYSLAVKGILRALFRLIHRKTGQLETKKAHQT
jgi:hypothetical protein